MQDVFDFWWIIYATIAVVIFVKLRSVLGQRTGRERPPYDPYSAREPVRPSTNDNVVALPGRAAEPPTKPVDAAAPAPDRWSGIAEPGSPVAAALDATAPDDKSFHAKPFIAGARAAYEMILPTYAQADRRTLKNPLSRHPY